MTGCSPVMQRTASEKLCAYSDCALANVYYSHPSNRRGILRAVLPSEEARCLLKGHSVRYTGQNFPTIDLDLSVDFAILRMFEEEADEECQVGLYVILDDIMKVEEEIHSCNAKLPLTGLK